MLWPYAAELFVTDAVDEAVAEAGIAPTPSSLRDVWDETVGACSRGGDAGGARTMATSTRAARRVRHTEHLGFILAEMQFLQRAYPDATW